MGHDFVEDISTPPTPGRCKKPMGAVDASAFAGITGQLLINRCWPPSRPKSSSSASWSPPCPPSLNGERIPGVALPRDPGEDFVEAEEMDPLHYVGFSEEYVETPATVKRQLGIAVTKEAIFFDRTGLVLDRASYVGRSSACGRRRTCWAC